ncbi:hypothetical protein BJX61DRAFT_541431 [Aspergillus egyptiacus]|nr:hypothetical protein BJX61DRAFT_541431 [Aspergillus egyptiacus]
MATTSLVVSVVGTLITALGFIDANMPEGPDQTKIQYVIANDGANGALSNAGGDLPDVRLFDETGEFLGAKYDPGKCEEGYTTCTTEVNTQEAVTYTLFTGNDDAICIAWTGIAWAGGQKKYGFHPGNWAYSCDQYTDLNSGSWYYAGQAVPGIENVDDVKCAWLDKDGNQPTTAFQVHWPEFDGDKAPIESLDYYCGERPPVEFYTSDDPNTIWRWTQSRRRDNSQLLDNSTAIEVPEAPERESKTHPASARRKQRLGNRFENDPRVIKSHYPKHKATELCDPTKNAAGQSFVSYAEKKFCYMPSKTIYPFCETVEDGPCWSDEDNRVIVQGNNKLSEPVPDLSHISNPIVWGS